jgi:hypothetical protein
VGGSHGKHSIGSSNHHVGGSHNAQTSKSNNRSNITTFTAGSNNEFEISPKNSGLNKHKQQNHIGPSRGSEPSETKSNPLIPPSSLPQIPDHAKLSMDITRALKWKVLKIFVYLV